MADAVVHIRQVPQGYQLGPNPEGLGEGNLFYLEAAAAILVALYVLLRGSELAYLAALLVAGSALTAVLLYRYVDVPALGPIPAMYEPVWFFEKTLSAVAEAAASCWPWWGWLRAAAPGMHTQPVAHALPVPVAGRHIADARRAVSKRVALQHRTLR